MLRPSGDALRQHVETQLLEQPRRHGRRGAVGGVDRDLETAEPLRVRQRQPGVRDVGVDDVRASTGTSAEPPTVQLRSATIASTSRSSASVNFSPWPENTLMPLSWNGLWDAEMTMPASKPISRVT